MFKSELDELIEKIGSSCVLFSTMTDSSCWFIGCRVSDVSFVQFIEALKVNTTLIEIYLGGTFKLFHMFCCLQSLFSVIGLQYLCLNHLIRK